jgi:hypothetical protein
MMVLALLGNAGAVDDADGNGDGAQQAAKAALLASIWSLDMFSSRVVTA